MNMLTAHQRNLPRTPTTTGQRQTRWWKKYRQLLARGFNVNGRGLTSGGRGFDVGPVSSAATIYDDFEDGSLSEYPSNSKMSIVDSSSGEVYEGTYALEYTTSGGSDGTGTTAITGPGPGTTFTCRVWKSVNNDWPLISWGVQSDYQNSQQRSYFNLSLRDELRFGVDTTLLASTAVDESLYNTEWLEFEVQWASDDTQTCTMYDSSGTQVAQISAQDSTYGQGGIGFGTNNFNGDSSTMYFDWYIEP